MYSYKRLCIILGGSAMIATGIGSTAYMFVQNNIYKLSDKFMIDLLAFDKDLS